MSSLIEHQQLQRGLNSITHMADSINRYRIEENVLIESIRTKKKETEELNIEERRIRNMIGILNKEIEEKQQKIEELNRYLYSGNSSLRKLIQNLQRVIGKKIATSNIIKELDHITQKKQKEVDIVEQQGKLKQEQYIETIDQLQKVENNIQRMINQEEFLRRNLKKQDEELKRKWEDLGVRETHVSQREKKAKVIEKRLSKYAKELNINLDGKDE